MKPPQFEYMTPSSVEAALEELSKGDGDVRPLAGGQSLIPLLNFRLSEPAGLVDLQGIPGLRATTVDDSLITIGAMTPVARLLGGDVATASPLLSTAARLVAHPQIRARGTVGGSIAHADPAAELPAVAVLTDASVTIAAVDGRRDIAAADFFEGLFTTACDWNQLVVDVRFPRLAPYTGWGFCEFARRPGDFALAGTGVILSVVDELITSARITAFGVAAVPMRVEAAEASLRGRRPTEATIADAADALMQALDPSDTPHGSGAYRRRLCGVLIRRAIRDALSRVAGTTELPR